MLALTGLFGLLMMGVLADAAVKLGTNGSTEDSDADAGIGQDLPAGGDLLGTDHDTPRTDTSEWDLLLTDPWQEDIDTHFDEFPDGDRPDSTDGEEGAEDLHLETGADGALLNGGTGGDTLFGGDGNDTLAAGEGSNHLDGGAGDDLLIGGTGSDTLFGGTGNDTIHAGGGDNLLFGGPGNDLLVGGPGSDSLFGGSGDDTLIAGDGGDTLSGGHGDDLLIAGRGNDLLFGGAGNDTLVGARLDGDGNDFGGNNTLNGGAGDDLLILGRNDLAHGGSGSDTFMLGSWIDEDGTATIVDFDLEQDRLVVVYDPAAHPDPAVEVLPDPGTPGAVFVLLDGVALAHVLGGAELTPADIALEPELPSILQTE